MLTLSDSASRSRFSALQGKACRKQDLGSCENLSLQDTEQFKSQILEGNIQPVVLIYDNLLLKGTQIQSWWLVPLNCAPPYNNADIGSGQLALPEIGSVACQENRVSVCHLPVPRCCCCLSETWVHTYVLNRINKARGPKLGKGRGAP